MTVTLLLALGLALAAPGEELCVVSGKVVDRQTGEALRKAGLSLETSGGRDRRSYAAKTDAGGSFTFQDVEPGSYRLSASRFGYVRQQYNPQGDTSGVVLKLRPGQQLTDLRFELTPQGVIIGRALDEDGDPMPGMSMMLLRYRYISGQRSLAPATTSRTNDIGEFRISQVHPGRYYLMANRNVRSSMQLAGETDYVSTFYPQSADLSGGALIAIKAGQLLQGMDVRVQQARVFTVRGIVVDGASNAPVDGVVLSLTPNGNAVFSTYQRWSTTSRNGGIFELPRVSAGNYVLSTTGRSRRRRETSNQGVARQPLSVGAGGVEGVTVTLQPPLELAGQVRMEGDEDVDLSGLRISLAPAAGFLREYGSRLEDDGSFHLPGLVPDHYSLNLYNLPEGVYPKSARIGRTEVLNGSIDITAGVPGEIDLIFSAKGAEVAGTVTDSDDQPAGGVLVTMLPEGETRHPGYLYKTVRSQMDGSFRLSGVTPGDYRIYAWERIEQGAYMDPDFVRPFEDFGADVSLDESDVETLQLGMIPEAAVSNGR